MNHQNFTPETNRETFTSTSVDRRHTLRVGTLGLSLAAGLSLGLSGKSQAQNSSSTPASVQAANPLFPSIMTTQGRQLVLNGWGSRYKAIFKVYEMGLYVTERISSAEQIKNLTGPVYLSLVASRELPGTDLGRLFIRGLQENSSKEMVARHVSSTNRLIEIFSGKPKLMPGERFAMEFIPGQGVQFFISGALQGKPVGDLEFFQMILRIWLGPNPADLKLKDALMGINW